MSIEVRPVNGGDEAEALDKVTSIAFGTAWRPPSEERRRLGDRVRDPARTRVVVDGGRIAGGFGTYDFELTLPGGSRVPVAGLTSVAVDPTRTGRGLLRHLMAAHLDDARSRGEVATTLLASESGLYRRFGYGWATSMAVYEATSSEAQLRTPLVDPGDLELVTDTAVARKLAAEVYAEVGRRVAGTISRSEAWWDLVFSTERGFVGGGPQVSVVHRDRDGVPDGYLLYTVESSGPDQVHWTPSSVVHVRELVALDATAQLALWQYCTRLPLTRQVRWLLAPVDPPVRWHLADPRQLRTLASHDHLWVRVLDVAAALGSRRYATDGRTCLHVEAPEDPEVHGPWTLEVAEGRAEVVRGGTPAASLDLASLGSVLLGELAPGSLAGAGLLRAEPEVVGLLDRMFATGARPFCLTKF